MAFTKHHLASSGPVLQPELIDNLKGISIQCLIDNLYQYLSLYPFSVHKSHLQSSLIFGNILCFLSGLVCSIYFHVLIITNYIIHKNLKIEQSEYQILQDCLIDRVLKKQLDIAYEKLGPSVQSFSCLLVHQHDPSDKYWRQSLSANEWLFAAAHLTDFHDFNNLSQPDIFIALETSPVFSLNFFHNATRAGKYVIDAKIYATTSLICYRYLFHSHIIAPINIVHNSQINITRRHNSPWKWRIYKKYLDGLHIPKAIEYAWKITYKDRCSQFLQRCLPKTYRRCKAQRMHSNMTLTSLIFLHRALPKSAKCKELISFATAKKPFSQHALKYPVRVKKCKAAIAAYLERVQAEDTDRREEAFMQIS